MHDLDTYRERAGRFLEGIEREYYLHLAGLKPQLEIEPIYAEFGDLFDRPEVEWLREATAAARGEEARCLAHLLHFCVDGHLGRETRAEAEELARLEASLEVEAADARHPYRAVPIAQANEPDAERRLELQQARDAILVERLNPLHLAALERSRAIVAELGWPSYRAAYAELLGIDLDALAGDARSFVRATDPTYAAVVDPELEAAGVPALGGARRSDLPRLFRAPALDPPFAAEAPAAALAETLAGLGLSEQPNVHLDVEPRATKSPRAFCATPRVPGEIYLVIAPAGGREDFAALFHEGGHAQHYAHVDPDLAFEHRHLGDNTVTESFAFLFEHLTADPAWLARRLGVADAEPIAAHARAAKLVMLRRYAAKIAYEVELHGEDADLDAMPGRYAELLGGAIRVAWPTVSWLADLDDGFYAACYLRAWALETHWRRELRGRFGARWFESREAGAWLRGLWRSGQRLRGEELLADLSGEELSLTPLYEELAGADAEA